MHDVQDAIMAEGIATVERGRGWVSRLVAALAGFPPAGADVPVRVSFIRARGREIWRRQFAATSFESVQEAGRGRAERLLVERFGPLAFGIALVLQGERLHFVVRRWSLFGLPLPTALAPRGECYETARDGRFHFHVELQAPLAGLIIQYRGWLARPG